MLRVKMLHVKMAMHAPHEIILFCNSHDPQRRAA